MHWNLSSSSKPWKPLIKWQILTAKPCCKGLSLNTLWIFMTKHCKPTTLDLWNSIMVVEANVRHNFTQSLLKARDEIKHMVLFSNVIIHNVTRHTLLDLISPQKQ
jgi:hypothetical protein